MSIKSLKASSTTLFALTGSLVIGLFLISELLNNRFWLNDFKVMYSAAAAFINNEQVYGVAFGLASGFYKYSPFTILVFIPYTLISFKAACIIHFILIGACAITVIILLKRLIKEHFPPIEKKHYISLLFLFTCVILHLIRDLHLGNINMILVFLLTLALYKSLNNKPISAGALLAFTILAKPYFLICLLPLLAQKKFKTVISSSAWLIAFIVTSILTFGPSKGITLYSDWFAAMLDHSDYLSSSHTILALINSCFGVLIPPNYGLYLLGIIAILSSLYFFNMNKIAVASQKESPIKENTKLIVHFYLLMGIIPSLLITDTEHFLFSMPLIAILLFQLRMNSTWSITLFILLIFMYGGNSFDLLGKELSGNFNKWGVLGISNLLIIGTIIYWFRNRVYVKSNDS